MKAKVALLSFLASAIIALSSCSRVTVNPKYLGPEKRPEAVTYYYDYQKNNLEAIVTETKEKNKYNLSRIEIPSSELFYGTGNIRADYYEQKKQGKHPTIMLLPISPVSNRVDFVVKGFAEYFASNNFNCVIVHNRKLNTGDTRTGEKFEAYFRQSVLDNRQVLDYLETRDKVNANKFGLIGISFGGIKAGASAGVDERIKCSVLCITGGSMADICRTSSESKIRKSIDKLKEEYGIPENAIYSEIEGKVRTNPIELGKYIDANNTLMYIAKFDKVIPAECGENLRSAIGKPKTVYLFSGHYTSAIYLPFIQAEALNFFREKLDVKK